MGKMGKGRAGKEEEKKGKTGTRQRAGRGWGGYDGVGGTGDWREWNWRAQLVIFSKRVVSRLSNGVLCGKACFGLGCTRCAPAVA